MKKGKKKHASKPAKPSKVVGRPIRGKAQVTIRGKTSRGSQSSNIRPTGANKVSRVHRATVKRPAKKQATVKRPAKKQATVKRQVKQQVKQQVVRKQATKKSAGKISQQRKKIIRRRIQRQRNISIQLRRERVAAKFRKISQESFRELEGRARKTWQRYARLAHISYDAYKRRLRKKHRSFSFRGIEAARRYVETVVLIKKGRSRGKYKLLNLKTGRFKTISASAYARTRSMRRYWSEIRWIASLSGISMTEARRYHKSATEDGKISYEERE